MVTESGRDPSGQALAVPATPANAVDGPAGFDPSRVRVTAADYNGATWDGCPFSHIPKWLESALRLGAVQVVADDRDYALWSVETSSGPQIAEPGDDIVCQDGHLGVQKDSYLAAIATEARRAETLKDGSVHEGAGPKDIAQNQSGTTHAN